MSHLSQSVGPGPLEGIRVVDASQIFAAPFGATLLGDLGADVVKVELPDGDSMRGRGGSLAQLQRDGESTLFLGANRNKRSMVLDLPRPEAQAVFARLLKTADALVTNIREPALSGLGLSYDQVCQHRPDIIWVGLSAFGPDGPYARRPGLDYIIQAMGGLMALTGEPGRPPVRAGVSVVDVMASLLVATGVLAALHERTRSGQGQRIEVALLDAMIHAASTSLSNYLNAGWVVPRTGNRSPYAAPSNVYTCGDGKLVCITSGADKFFVNVCKALEVDWVEDQRFGTPDLRRQNEDELDRLIDQRCKDFTRAELIERLVAADVMAAPVNQVPEVVQDPQVRHNKMVVPVEHATIGTIEVTGVPLHLYRTPGGVRLPPPVLGQHTEEVLAELGYAPEEMAQLERDGIVVSHGGATHTGQRLS
jgi:crotonobetainyl-CoA:carnitine CoA-transferase CaiB-like acyl-CoA transferase